MNLAAKDIRHNLGRFALTAAGIGLLLMTVLGMNGIYRGMVDDALVVGDRIGADLWVVQRGTCRPFAEISRVPASLEHRLRAVPGVASARSFVSHNVQREHRRQPLRMNVHGLAWPEDKGAWITLTAGRPLGQAHYEMIADATLGLALGEKLVLGKDTYTVVGLPEAWSRPAGTESPSSPRGTRWPFNSISPAKRSGCSAPHGSNGPSGRTSDKSNRCCSNARGPVLPLSCARPDDGQRHRHARGERS